ncbi:hypothetical protein Scep_014957 [Stephania cephalantha]|uniref:Uncharacterized protein n=1 Tax=Stephania cephalantha TaxID=152367 RepID=A0AAP0J256_9MAGN
MGRTHERARARQSSKRVWARTTTRATFSRVSRARQGMRGAGTGAGKVGVLIVSAV